MIYKTLTLVVMFILFLGVNNSNAQVTFCDIEEAVGDVYEAADGVDWNVGNGLNVHLAKLDDWCPGPGKKSKIPNILEGMEETVLCALAGEEEIIDGLPVWVDTPEEVKVALEILGALLEGAQEDFTCTCIE